jgi:hypothetical protein
VQGTHCPRPEVRTLVKSFPDRYKNAQLLHAVAYLRHQMLHCDRINPSLRIQVVTLSAPTLLHDTLTKAHPSLRLFPQLHLAFTLTHAESDPSFCAALWRSLFHSNPAAHPAAPFAQPPDPFLEPFRSGPHEPIFCKHSIRAMLPNSSILAAPHRITNV